MLTNINAFSISSNGMGIIQIFVICELVDNSKKLEKGVCHSTLLLILLYRGSSAAVADFRDPLQAL